MRKRDATHLAGPNANYVFDPVVYELRGGQSHSSRCRPHGAAGTEVCRRYCHYGGAICNFIPTVAQNPKGLAAPRIGRIFLMQTVYFGMTYFAFVNGVAAGIAALIFSLQPLLVGLLAPRRSAETVSWPQWLG